MTENKDLRGGIRISVTADTKCCLYRLCKALNLTLAGPGRIDLEQEQDHAGTGEEHNWASLVLAASFLTMEVTCSATSPQIHICTQPRLRRVKKGKSHHCSIWGRDSWEI